MQKKCSFKKNGAKVKLIDLSELGGYSLDYSSKYLKYLFPNFGAIYVCLSIYEKNRFKL